MLGWRCDQWQPKELGPDGKQSRGASRILDDERRKTQPFFAFFVSKTQTRCAGGLQVFNALLLPTICSVLVFTPSTEAGLPRYYTASGIHLAVPLTMTVAQHCGLVAPVESYISDDVLPL
jgi:hypothetical protein